MTGPSRKPEAAHPGGVPIYGLILFIALAGFWTIFGLTRGVEHLGGDQHLNMILVLKQEDPTLFARDLIFGRADFLDEYIPLYIAFLRHAYRFTGDLAGGYKLLVFPVTFIYLIGAYFAFLRIGGNRPVAVVLALFSSLPTSVLLADEFFGVGPVGWMVARTIFNAALPFLFLGLARWFDRPGRLLLLFLEIGILANVHPVSALYAASMLIVAYLVEVRASGWGWLTAAGMGGSMLMGAAPILWNQLHHLAKQAATSARVGEAAVAQIAAERLGYIRYPPASLAGLPRIVVDGLTLAILAGSLALVFHGWRRRERQPGLALRLVTVAALAYLLFPEGRLWCTLLALLSLLPSREEGGRDARLVVYFSLAIFWVTITELLLCQFGPDLFRRPVLHVVLTRGARFAVFAVFLMLAIAVRRVDWPRAPRMVRIACIALLIVTGIWQLRHTVRTYLRTRGDPAAADLAAMATWAREHTKPADLFLFDSAAFRVMARRSLVVSTKDGDTAVANRPDAAAAWLERQAAVRSAGVNPEALREVGVRYDAQYVVVPAATVRGANPALDIQYANGTYAVLATDEVRRSGRPTGRGGPS